MGFLNVALTGLLNFSKLMKEMQNWIVWKKVWKKVSICKYLPIHQRPEKNVVAVCEIRECY